MAEYILDRSWEPELRRLELQEHTLDPLTFDHLRRIGVQTGWCCLEVGAGAGSVVRWLSDRVGAAGKVVAIDIDTKLIDHLSGPTVEVHQEDLMSADLSGGFDLVHCRLVLGHLQGKEGALRKIHEAVRPGGWLLVEESDSLWALVEDPPNWPPAEETRAKLAKALTRLWKEIGFDPWWGRNLLARFCAMGLEHIGGEVRSPLIDSASSELAMTMMARFRDQMIERGFITEQDYAAYEKTARDPEWKTFLWFLTSIWGQKSIEAPASA
jgi:2-polyprenyl-3-methyl-5-hydroxy-6-metoxy-1,4-benzoquinol methylase